MGKFENRLSAWQDLQGKLKTICLAVLYIFWQRIKKGEART